MIRIVFILLHEMLSKISYAAMVRRWDSFLMHMKEMVSPLSRHWVRDIAKR